MNSSRAKNATGPWVAGVIVGGVNQTTIKRALGAGAELLELRVDTFARREPHELVRQIKRLKAVKGYSTPIIITVRCKAEGGDGAMDDPERLRVFTALMPFADYVDIELSSTAILKDVIRLAKRTKTKVIVSYHNFTSTPAPAKLQTIIRKGRKSGGDIVKIATTARRTSDIKTLAGVLLGNPKMIVIAMGPLGASTRVFFPTLGSLVTYGSLSRATAPGQLPIKELVKRLNFYAPKGG
jgi:3-dehydroquinate dehydratase-1